MWSGSGSAVAKLVWFAGGVHYLPSFSPASCRGKPVHKKFAREEEGGYSAPLSIVLPNMGMMCNIVLASQQLRRALPKFLKVHIFLCGIYKLSGFRTIQCISRDRGKEIKEEGFFILNGRSLGCKIAGPIHLHGPWFCPDKIDHKTNETNSNIQILTK